jgi:branched-chain amino acid transport system substrate-binding protein
VIAGFWGIAHAFASRLHARRHGLAVLVDDARTRHCCGAVQDRPDSSDERPVRVDGAAIDAAVRLYVEQNGTRVAGRRVELLLRDDAGNPEQTRRVAQELVANEKVSVLAGFGITPSALAVAPVITQAKVPAVIMSAATSSIVASSPYFVRTSYTLPQTSMTMADWATRNNLKKFVTLVSDYGPGIDAEKSFKERVLLGGGQIVGEIRVPVRSPDFAPFLQRVRDLQPDAVFVFVPSGPASALMKQFTERGLDKTGIRLIGDGGLTDDDLLPEMGDVALGVVNRLPLLDGARFTDQPRLRQRVHGREQDTTPQQHGRRWL